MHRYLPYQRRSSSGNWIHLRSKELIRCLCMGRVDSCLEDCQEQQKSCLCFLHCLYPNPGNPGLMLLLLLKAYGGVAGGLALQEEAVSLFPFLYPNHLLHSIREQTTLLSRSLHLLFVPLLFLPTLLLYPMVGSVLFQPGLFLLS